MSKRRLWALAAFIAVAAALPLVLLAAGAAGPPDGKGRQAGPPASIRLTPDPLRIRCDAVDASTLTVLLLDADGKPVADGTDVFFDVRFGFASPVEAQTQRGEASTEVRLYEYAQQYGDESDVTVYAGDLRASINIGCLPPGGGGCPPSPPQEPTSPPCPPAPSLPSAGCTPVENSDAAEYHMTLRAEEAGGIVSVYAGIEDFGGGAYRAVGWGICRSPILGFLDATRLPGGPVGCYFFGDEAEQTMLGCSDATGEGVDSFGEIWVARYSCLRQGRASVFLGDGFTGVFDYSGPESRPISIESAAVTCNEVGPPPCDAAPSPPCGTPVSCDPTSPPSCPTATATPTSTPTPCLPESPPCGPPPCEPFSPPCQPLTSTPFPTATPILGDPLYHLGLFGQTQLNNTVTLAVYIGDLGGGPYQAVQWHIDYDEQAVSVASIDNTGSAPAECNLTSNNGTRVLVGCYDLTGPNIEYFGDVWIITFACSVDRPVEFRLVTNPSAPSPSQVLDPSSGDALPMTTNDATVGCGTDLSTPAPTPTACDGCPTPTPTPLYQMGVAATETSPGVITAALLIQNTGGGPFEAAQWEIDYPEDLVRVVSIERADGVSADCDQTNDNGSRIIAGCDADGTANAFNSFGTIFLVRFECLRQGSSGSIEPTGDTFVRKSGVPVQILPASPTTLICSQAVPG